MASETSTREQRILDERASVYDGMVAIMEKMDEKPDDVTVEERSDFDARELRLEELDKDLARVRKFEARENGRDEVAETRGVSRDEMDGDEDAYTRAYREWFIRGEKEMSSDMRATVSRGRHTPTELERRDVRAQLDSSSLQTVPGQGGYMIPQGFWQNLQVALKAYGGLLNEANIVKTATGNEMPWPTNNPTGVVGSYITEANQIGFQDYNFGQGILYAWTITSGIVLASYQLLEDSAFDVGSFVTERMGEAIGRKVAQELWSGAGSASKALTGLTTAIAANGGSGSGSLSSPGYVQAAAGGKVYQLSNFSGTGAGSAQFQSGLATWGDLTRMIGAVDVAYRNAAAHCTFVMNDAQLQLERQLTDGFGHPLWEPNTQAGQPDTILGYPVTVDNNCPSVSTGSSAVAGGILFGDIKRALVVRQVDMAGTMQLRERYADYLQVGYLSYVRMDSQPNDLRAVVSFQTNTS